jgi:hypothetical protein
VVLADAGHGNDTAFRAFLEGVGLHHVVGIQNTTGFLISAASSDADVLGMKIGPLGPSRAPSALNKSSLQPWGSSLQRV